MSKNLKIEIRPVFRSNIRVRGNTMIGSLLTMIENHKGDIARQPVRYVPASGWFLAVDFDQPADRMDFEASIKISRGEVMSSVDIFVPTTCRA